MRALVLLAILAIASSHAQSLEAELRVSVRDPLGRPVPAGVEIAMRQPEFAASDRAGSDGHARLHRLPLGIAHLRVSHPGFRTHSQPVELRSAVPVELDIVLEVGTVATEVTVQDSAPLLDPHQPALVLQVGQRQLTEAAGTTLGRGLTDLITSMPGWILEANAVLHPRGSEYDTQYVIDGMPLYDNRSLAFAPAFLNTEFDAVNILTGGIPAEYGRRLGGVVAFDTRRTEPGTEVSLQAGSYSTRVGALAHHRRHERTAWSAALHGGSTDRYLDPPSLENFTNTATAFGFHGRLDRDIGTSDRLALYLRSNRTGFLVPNDPEQQELGQRQDRRAAETAGQAHWQHTFTSNTLASVRGMVRDLDARLWSNESATPVNVHAHRGFREANVLGSVAVEGERQSLKFGGDVRLNWLDESFRLDGASFGEARRSTESSLFVQDHLRFGNFAANVGVRFDDYRLLLQERALSPRAAVSYYVPKASLLLRASYDRVFQPPPAENLLVSSAAARLGFDELEGSLPVPATRGNFYEVGVRKAFRNMLRLDVSHYWRTFRNYADDDVFLNTGLSFPITFDTARIDGTEVRIEMPSWRRVSSWVSWSNMHGAATGPVTGGLFIEGGEAEELRDSDERFPITQDQRNTVAAQVRVEPSTRLWIAGMLRYGSGLPFEESDDADYDDLPPAILQRIDFGRGRIRPNVSFDASLGARLWRQTWLQLDVRNIADRLNIVNFSGVFSGTAIAPGRQVTVQLRTRF